MSGTDANAIYQATHDQRMNRTWNDIDGNLLIEANDMLTNLWGKPLIYRYDTGDEQKDQTDIIPVEEIYNDNLFYPDEYVDEGAYDNLYFKPQTFGGQALNEAYRLLGQKPETARQEWTPGNKYDAYVAGADSTIIPGQVERLWEGIGSFAGIPDKLLIPGAKPNMYSRILEKWLEENRATPLGL